MDADEDYTIIVYSDRNRKEVVYNILFRRYDPDIEQKAIMEILSRHNNPEFDLGFTPADSDVLVQLLLLRDNKGAYQKLEDFFLSEFLSPIGEEDDIPYGDAA